MRADNEWDFRGVRCKRYEWIEYDEDGEAENRKTTFDAVIGKPFAETYVSADLCPYSCDNSDLETWLLSGCPNRIGHGPLTTEDLAYLFVIRRAQESIVAHCRSENPEVDEVDAMHNLHAALNTPAFVAIKKKAWPDGPQNPCDKLTRTTTNAT